MADTTENVVISVQDKVADSIAPKLQLIEQNALNAMDAFTRMQKSINNIDGSAFNRMANAVGGNNGKIKAALASLNQFSAAQARMSRTVDALTAAIGRQTTALAGLQTALAGLTAAYTAAAAAGVTLRGVAQATARGVTGVGNAMGGMGGNTRIASGTLSVLLGNMTSGRYIAGRFLTSVLGLGSVLQAAFPIIGAVALIMILAKVVESFITTRNAALNAGAEIARTWQQSIDATTHSTDNLLLENSRLEQQLANLNKQPSSNEMVIFFNDAVVAVDSLIEKMDSASDKWTDMVNKTKISGWQQMISGQQATAPTQQFLVEAYRPVQQAYTQLEDDKRRIQASDASAADKTKQLNDARVKDVNNLIAAYATLQKQISTYDGQLTELQRKHLSSEGAPQFVGASSVGAPVFTQDTRPADQSANLTLLGQAYKQVGADSDYAKIANTNATLVPQVNALRDALRGQKDAAAEAREQIKQYDLQLQQMESRYKGTPGTDVMQAQTAVNFWQGEQASPQTQAAAQPEVTTKLAEAQDKLTEAHNKQAAALDKLRTEYSNNSTEMNLYGNELKQYETVASIVAKLTEDGISVFSREGAAILAAGERAGAAARQHQLIADAFNRIHAPEQELVDGTLALQKALAQGVITADEYSAEWGKIAQKYNEATNPLQKFNEQMQENQKLFGAVGIQRNVGQQVNQLDMQTQQKFGRPLTSDENSQATSSATTAAQQAEVQKELESVYSSTAGAIQQMAAQQVAWNVALKEGLVTAQQFNNAMIQNAASIANARLAAGNYSNVLNDIGSSVIGKVMTGFQSLGSAITNTIGATAVKAMDGVSDTLARWIVYGGNAGKMFRELGEQIAESILSALIKIGIQEGISVTLGKALSAAAMATAAPMAAAAAAMWAPAAIAASIATFGGAAAAGSTAYTASIAAGTAVSAGLASAGFAADGAYVGYDNTFPGSPRGTDTYPYWLSKGEYVMNASATQRNLPTLQSIQAGRDVGNTPISTGAIGSTGMKVSVTHDGSTSIQVVQGATHDEVRIIAQSAARDAVTNHAPRVIASDLQNPNSQTSKAMVRNNNIGRRRD